MKQKLRTAVLALWLTAALSVSAFGQQPAQSVATLDDAPKSYLTETPYVTQCELGCVVADALGAAGQTQLALAEMGLIANDLPQGDLTEADFLRVFHENAALGVTRVTPRVLRQLLEQSVSALSVDPATEQIRAESQTYGGFCQVSGFSFRYDASAPAGERVQNIYLENGDELSLTDDSATYTLTATVSLLEGGYGFPALDYVSLDSHAADALETYVSTRTALPEGETERIRVMGARTNAIVGLFPKQLVVVGVGALAAVLALTGLKSKRRREETEPKKELEHGIFHSR